MTKKIVKSITFLGMLFFYSAILGWGVPDQLTDFVDEAYDVEYVCSDCVTVPETNFPFNEQLLRVRLSPRGGKDKFVFLGYLFRKPEWVDEKRSVPFRAWPEPTEDPFYTDDTSGPFRPLPKSPEDPANDVFFFHPISKSLKCRLTDSTDTIYENEND